MKMACFKNYEIKSIGNLSDGSLERYIHIYKMKILVTALNGHIQSTSYIFCRNWQELVIFGENNQQQPSNQCNGESLSQKLFLIRV